MRRECFSVFADTTFYKFMIIPTVLTQYGEGFFSRLPVDGDGGSIQLRFEPVSRRRTLLNFQPLDKNRVMDALICPEFKQFFKGFGLIDGVSIAVQFCHGGLTYAV